MLRNIGSSIERRCHSFTLVGLTGSLRTDRNSARASSNRYFPFPLMLCDRTLPLPLEVAVRYQLLVLNWLCRCHRLLLMCPCDRTPSILLSTPLSLKTMACNCPAIALQAAQGLRFLEPPLHAGCGMNLSKAELHSSLCECISPWRPGPVDAVSIGPLGSPCFLGCIDSSCSCVCVSNTT